MFLFFKFIYLSYILYVVDKGFGVGIYHNFIRLHLDSLKFEGCELLVTLNASGRKYWAKLHLSTVLKYNCEVIILYSNV